MTTRPLVRCPPLRVFLLDDYDDPRFLWEITLLDHIGDAVEFVHLTDPRDAIKLVRNGLAPDLIVMGLLFPGCYGADAIRVLRCLGYGGTIVVNSGVLFGERVDEVAALDVDAALPMPVDLDELGRTVVAALSHRGLVSMPGE